MVYEAEASGASTAARRGRSQTPAEWFRAAFEAPPEVELQELEPEGSMNLD